MPPPSIDSVLQHLKVAMAKYPNRVGDFPTKEANLRLLGLPESVVKQESRRSFNYGITDPATNTALEIYLQCRGLRRCGAFILELHFLPTKLTLVQLSDILGVRFEWLGSIYDLTHFVDAQPGSRPRTYSASTGPWQKNMSVWVMPNEQVDSIFVGGK